MLRRLLVTAGASLGFVAATCSGALAGPVTFTWDSAASTPALPGGSTFSANNMVVSDNAAVTIAGPSGGTFTESAILPIIQFQLPPGTPVFVPNYGSKYSFYYTSSLSGTQGAVPTVVGTATTGSFTGGDFVLWGTPNKFISAHATKGAVHIISHDKGAFPLATGTLDSGTLSLTLTSTGYTPTASLVFSFDPCTGAGTGVGGVCKGDEASFFVSPNPLKVKLTLHGTFTADPSVIKLTLGTPTFLDINGGGGNLTLFSVPAPASILVLGVGLLGLGFVRRRSLRRS